MNERVSLKTKDKVKVMAKGGFPGGMGGMNMNQIIKQAQKMQADMEEKKEQLAQQTVEAVVCGGVVSVVANGANQIVEIKIAPEVIDPDDVEMLQDLVISAVNEALRKADEMVQTEMSKVTGALGAGMPGGMFR